MGGANTVLCSGMNMDIEIGDYPGRQYRPIRIHSLGFVGLLDQSADRRFGLAAGKVMPTGKRLMLYLLDGTIAWMVPDCSPMDIRFSDDGWGGFVESSGLCAFNQGGIVFRAAYPLGIGKVRSVLLAQNKMIFLGERFEFVYDITGNLLEKRRC